MECQRLTVNFPQRNISDSTLMSVVLSIIMYSMLTRVIEQNSQTDNAQEENSVNGQSKSARQLDDGCEDYI